MNAPPKLLYPSLVIAAISVTLFSLLGIATLTGYLPIAHSTPQELLAEQSTATKLPASAVTVAATADRSADASRQGGVANAAQAVELKGTASQPAGSGNPVAVAVSCATCGMVESISTVERKGNASGVGAVAGGLTGMLLGNQMGRGNGRTGMTVVGGAGGAYLGNRIEQNMQRTISYRVNVRMGDGKLRTLYQHEAPDVAVGRHVEIVGNTVVPRS